MVKIEDKLKNYMNSWVDAGRFSGTVMVCSKENILLQRGYGYANEQYKILNTVDTKYRIGSYTKQFTAVAILRLYENGDLRLDDSIRKYISEYNFSDNITIHNLLSHTSGIPNHTDFEEYSISEKITFNIILERLNKRQLNFKPGEDVEYSNSNYVLLAKIVEIISGIDIETYYNRYIFNVIGLNNTGVSKNEDIIPELAQGYSYSGEGIINGDYYDMTGAYGSGFLYSNVTDLLKWINSLKNHSIINIDATNKMLTPYGHIWYMGAWTGYGCFVKGNPAVEMSASGLISGYLFNVWHDLKNDFIIILLSNNDTTAISRIMNGMKNILLGEVSLVEIKPKIKTLDSYETYKSLEGKYRCKYTGAQFNISFENGDLLVDRLWVQEYKRKKFKLGFIDDNNEAITFACEVCDGKYVFKKNPDGSIREVMYISDVFSFPYEKINKNSVLS